MILFNELPVLVQGTIGLFIVLLLFATVINIIQGLFHRYYKHLVILIVMGCLLYSMFQCICDICSHMNTSYRFLNMCEDYLGQLPVIVLLLLILCITAVEIFIFRQNRRWEKENITPASIKEAIDNLPIGICCYEANGQVLMKNIMMENICFTYTGSPLLNAVSFRNAIYENKADTETDVIVILPEDKVVSMSDKVFSDEEPLLRVMTAADITEEYMNTQTLAAQQEMVVTLNKKLHDYGKQIVSSITAKEVLNAKVKLHDELGANLLAIKRFILNGGTAEERVVIENTLHRSLDYLKNDTAIKVKDEYAVILETAEKLGISIRVAGELTEKEPQRHVIVTGIHECLTNTIRHAGGDELAVILDEKGDTLTAEFRNSGKAPEGEIIERGGLVLLRKLTEKSGGTMEILSEPEFKLILKLPKEGTDHVI